MRTEIIKTMDDELLAEHYRRHWLDMGILQTEVAPGWCDSTLKFIGAARRDRAFGGFVARSEGHQMGSACCHVIDRVFPTILASEAGPGLTEYIGGDVVPAERGARCWYSIS